MLQPPRADGASLRFDFEPDVLPCLVLPRVYEGGAEYGFNHTLGLLNTFVPSAGRRKVVVEFANAPMWAAFRAKHLRSTIIGSFLSNLYDGAGWEVIRVNYLDERTPSKLGDIDQFSLEKLKESFARLNIEFAEYSGRSKIKEETVSTIEKLLEEQGISRYSAQGRHILDFGHNGLPGLDNVILKEPDSSGHILDGFIQDIAAATDHLDTYNPDKIIYVTGNGVTPTTLKTLQIMGGRYADLARKCQYIPTKIQDDAEIPYSNPRPQSLDDAIDTVAAHILPSLRDNKETDDPAQLAYNLAISAIIIHELSAPTASEPSPFLSLKDMTSPTLRTGPYLQSTHARLCALSRRLNLDIPTLRQVSDFALLKNEVAPKKAIVMRLIRLLAQWPDMVNGAMQTAEPKELVDYLFRVATRVDDCYKAGLKVFEAEEGEEMGLARAGAYEAAKMVLGNGLRLLGLTPVEKM